MTDVLAELEGDEPGHVTRIKRYSEAIASSDEIENDHRRPAEPRQSWIPWRRQ